MNIIKTMVLAFALMFGMAVSAGAKEQVTVGVMQFSKGSIPNAMIWVGYAFAQVGLWINLR